MQTARVPENEIDRQAALNRYHILDTPREEDYDEIVKLASEICKTPISIISLIDMNRQWFKSKTGLAVNETSRDHAFCTHAILQDNIFIVEDSIKDERFFDNPLVTNDPNIRFYAGMPLITPDGFKLGTLCVIDTIPRELDAFQKNAILILSKQIVNHLDKRLKINALNDALEKINIQQVALEQLNATSNRMLSIIGHDLRAPLSTLKTMLEMFSDDYLSPEDTRMMAGKLMNSFRFSNDLLDNLMFWARKQFDGEEPEIKEADIHQKVNECFELLNEAATQKGNVLINKLPPASTLNTDSDIFMFILRNLVANAIKFTNDGSITVELDKTLESNKVIISDTGLGIHQDKLSKLFNWDNKMSTYGTAGEKGSGLGLSMSQEFAQKLGGRIEVNSEINKGSQFYIIFPFSA